jgi:type IV secretion system protein VirD4
MLAKTSVKRGQPLMRPEEIMQMGPSDQLVLVNGMRPIMGQRIPFWHVDPWNGWANTNPVEGETPQAETLLRLRYTLEDEH